MKFFYKFNIVLITILQGVVLIAPTKLQAQGVLKREKITKTLSMEIPSSFVPMSVQQQRIKYVSDRTPIAMFTTEDGNVDLGINSSSTVWGPSDLPILKDFYRAGIINLYDSVQFLQDDIKNINDRTYIVFEFNGLMMEGENSILNRGNLSKYIYIQYTIREDKVMLFNFSSPWRLKAKWEEAAAQMMNSIKIK